jgi:hypothetical protein
VPHTAAIFMLMFAALMVMIAAAIAIRFDNTGRD